MRMTGAGGWGGGQRQVADAAINVSTQSSVCPLLQGAFSIHSHYWASVYLGKLRHRSH